MFYLKPFGSPVNGDRMQVVVDAVFYDRIDSGAVNRKMELRKATRLMAELLRHDVKTINDKLSIRFKCVNKVLSERGLVYVFSYVLVNSAAIID